MFRGPVAAITPENVASLQELQPAKRQGLGTEKQERPANKTIRPPQTPRVTVQPFENWIRFTCSSCSVVSSLDTELLLQLLSYGFCHGLNHISSISWLVSADIFAHSCVGLLLGALSPSFGFLEDAATRTLTAQEQYLQGIRWPLTLRRCAHPLVYFVPPSGILEAC